MLSTLQQVKEHEMQAWLEGIQWVKAHARQREFDSRFVTIDIKVFINDDSIKATVQTWFESLTNGLTDIVLDFDDVYTVDSIFGNATSYTLVGESLTVTLDRPYNTGEIFSVATVYHGRPRIIGGIKGFRFENHVGNVPVVATLCTPYLAHTWWPCVDGPADKLDSVHLFITIPDTSYMGYPLYAASNGTLIDTTHLGDGWVVFEWHENYPVVPYYVSVSISNYHIFSHTYYYNTDSMGVPYYVFPEDYESAQETFSATVNMIVFFANLFGEYPFITEKYSMAEIGFYGAIENQTKTIMGGVHMGWYMVVCHELAHMWFGDMISPVSWHHVWVNEGFATYCEALWWGDQYGMHEYHNYMDDLTYLDEGTIYLEDISDPFGIFVAIVYAKGAWVLHMLRHVVGDSTFFDILYQYATDPLFMYKNASTEDFQQVCETISGMDLSNFFNQWIYDERYPRYEYRWSSTHDTSGNYQVMVTIEQKQKEFGWRPVFVMPIDLIFHFSSGDTTVVVQNNDTLQTYLFEFSEEPTTMELDHDNWVLKVAWEGGVSEDEVADVHHFRSLGLYCSPNPVRGMVQIECVLPSAGEVTLDLYNAAGQRLACLDRRHRNAGVHLIPWNTEDLPAGIYFLRLTTSHTIAARKLNILR